ncbi:uncharacterized protein LOC143282703 isoform X2 [Babylonia areolata]|uniref:uncharacterized protein LOC143282703 isoform X2 n=1 Tax=Babylonia areolata TaxID=304850 RepID=UPI003FD39D0B
MSRKTTKMSSAGGGGGGGGTVFRAPSYFVWNPRKNVTSSPRQSPRTMAANTNMNNTQDQDGTVGDSGPSPRKMRSPRRRATGLAGADNQSTDTKSSVLSGDSGGLVTISPKHKDPDRIKKDREREERVRQARERLEQERKRKLIDLQEQQRQAQENREKQLEMRRKKIEDLRRRDVERRAEVEKRRREKENAERSRRETLLLKAEERVARYEAWKRSGQKGGRSHVLGFGSATPRHVCLPYERPRRSSSHSALARRSPNGSDSDYSVFRPQRRALSACSTVRRHCCVDLNRTAPSAPLPTRPKSVVTLNISSLSSPGGVKLRDKAPRKPRPASVGTSMPSFVTLEPPRSSPRSKSTDRLARERSRPRGSAASARRADEKEEKKAGDKNGVKMSRRTLDRLSTPRQIASVMGDKKEPASSTTPRRETVARMSARKAFSTSNLAVSPQKSSFREKTPKETPAKTPQQPSSAPPAAAAPTTTGTTSTPPSTRTSSATRTPVRVVSPGPGADEDGGSTVPQTRSTPTTAPAEKPSADISAEEYKAKLAEKRRQAREKAEKEAEEERKRQEELERQEEEKRRQEEEEQRRRDEEALRLAEEATKAEEERLQKAIEAEEARRAEEAARLEQERLAKEEADRKAKEEAERLELERQEKARRDEEERQERKKRLEMIMKRVKTDSPAEGAKDSKSLTSSPARSINSTASSDTSPTEPDNKTVQAMAAQSAAAAAEFGSQETGTKPLGSAPSQDDSDGQDAAGKEAESHSPASAPSPVTTSDQQTAPTEQGKAPEDKMEGAEVVPDQVSSVPSSPAPQAESGVVERSKFKSPLLQKLVEGKDDGGSSPGGGPRFKSPLLQNLLGKTKLRSMGSSQEHSMSDPSLSHMDSSLRGQGDGDGSSVAPVSDVMSTSMVDMGTSDSSQKEVMSVSEEKDVDTSEDSSSSHSSPSWVSGKHIASNGNEDVSSIAVSAPSHEEDVSPAVQPEPMEISTPMETSATPALMAGSTASFWGAQDSGVSFGSDDLRSAAPSGSLQVSFNGHGPSRLVQSQGLEDSSISMRSIESVTSSITDSAAGSVFSSVTSLPPGHSLAAGDRDFEEIIDLPVNNKTSASTTAPSTLTVLDNTDDVVNFNKLEEGTEDTTAVPPPIIAFEDRRQDVPDLLS